MVNVTPVSSYEPHLNKINNMNKVLRETLLKYIPVL